MLLTNARIDGTVVALLTVLTGFLLRLTALRFDLHIPSPGPKDAERLPSPDERP